MLLKNVRSWCLSQERVQGRVKEAEQAVGGSSTLKSGQAPRRAAAWRERGVWEFMTLKLKTQNIQDLGVVAL